MKGMNVLQTIEHFQALQARMNSGLFLLAILTTLVASLVAAGMYKFFYESRATGSQVHRAFPLLGIAMTAIFISVQVSIPLSLGLMGSLSIIRFRTPIKEPEEIGFIMLVIAAALAAALLNFRFIVVLYAVAFASLCVIRGARTWRFLRRDGILVVTLPDAEAEQGYGHVMACLRKAIRRCRLESTSSHDGVTSVQLSFSGLKSDVMELQQALRRAAPVQTVNVFLDRPGGLR